MKQVEAPTRRGCQVTVPCSAPHLRSPARLSRSRRALSAPGVRPRAASSVYTYRQQLPVTGACSLITGTAGVVVIVVVVVVVSGMRNLLLIEGDGRCSGLFIFIFFFQGFACDLDSWRDSALLASGFGLPACLSAYLWKCVTGFSGQSFYTTSETYVKD
ncbi:hypothetical protein E2C01_091139 [Portunus trituberculatus]|uniref:Uncharacterized protein n=1 Tax=Portunus trituberculatus TaxID=210409 RepID=A0A5B7JM71_PORTR|nr:hypothetical protein [Portunus trituberculatus]